MKKILAWHFTDGMSLRDGQSLEVGGKYTYEGEVKICESGYHASRRLIDALKFASGSQLSHVECWGDVQEQGDKLVARNRTVLWTIDATMILHEFACQVAEIALSKIENPDPHSLAAIDAKRKWIRGEISDEEFAAARSAARYATGSATRYAARYAADSAARYAAWYATDSAADSAARYAAWYATDSAAESVARYAAESAAEDAAWSDFDTLLTQMVEDAHQEATE